MYLTLVKVECRNCSYLDLLLHIFFRFDNKVDIPFRYYFTLMPICCFILPPVIPVYLWNETWWNGFFVCSILRYVAVLNLTWGLNSAAHMFGNKPYDRFIKPVEILSLAILTLGEGFHNFHHTFPWDYKTGEYGTYSSNLTNCFLDFMAWIGWAYDLKMVSEDVVKRRLKRTGDGSHHIWGWGDRDQSQEEINHAIVVNKTQ
jgi:stearoyl-CoA desaturase (Delta-9 desaturase)